MNRVQGSRFFFFLVSYDEHFGGFIWARIARNYTAAAAC